MSADTRLSEERLTEIEARVERWPAETEAQRIILDLLAEVRRLRALLAMAAAELAAERRPATAAVLRQALGADPDAR